MRWKCPDSNDISQKYHLEFHAVFIVMKTAIIKGDKSIKGDASYVTSFAL